MSEQERSLKLLSDVILSIGLVEEYVENVPNPHALLGDQEKVDAVERRFGIIGEALTQLQRLGIMVPSRDWAINFRNTLIHQYDATFATTLFRRVRDDLPNPREEAEALITQIEASSND